LKKTDIKDNQIQEKYKNNNNKNNNLEKTIDIKDNFISI